MRLAAVKLHTTLVNEGLISILGPAYSFSLEIPDSLEDGNPDPAHAPHLTSEYCLFTDGSSG